MPKKSEAPYVQDILDDVTARQSWARKDAEIKKRRLGFRKKKKSKPYPGAPNFVVPIIDDVVTDRTEQEVSMMLNAPQIVNFIPIGNTSKQLALKAQQAFDIYLRHVIAFREQVEYGMDMKNARGFSVGKVYRRNHPKYGVIPDVAEVDPRDCIAPVDTRKARDAERLPFVMRYSRRDFENKKMAGWNHIDDVLAKLHENHQDENSGERQVKQSDHDEDSPVKVTEDLVGINASDYGKNVIVVWEIFKYASKWDVRKDKTGELKLNKKCRVYVCPDAAEYLLFAKAWKDEDEVEELPSGSIERIRESLRAVSVGEEPSHRKITRVGKDRPWPVAQHRFENRDPTWYASRGIGEKSMDDQIAATGELNAKMTHNDYASHMLFVNPEGAAMNNMNVRPKPGAVLPRGIIPATMPQSPIDHVFNIEFFKRSAAQRSGGGQQLYSGQVGESRKLQKTATEQISQDARESVMSSASVDRFNEPFRELYELLWEDLKRLNVDLPVIAKDGQLAQQASEEIYAGEYIIVPAASQRTLNPDMQFQKSVAAMQFVAPYMQMTPMRIYESLLYTLSHYDPQFAEILLIDPSEKGPGALPPVYEILQKLVETVTNSGKQSEHTDKVHDSEIMAALKLSQENSTKVEELDVVLTEFMDLTRQQARNGSNGSP